MHFQIGSMTVGDVLDRGVKLLVARFPLLFGINLIVMSPMIVFSLIQPFFMQALVADGPGNEPPIGAAIGMGGGAMFALFLYLLLIPIGVAATLTVTIREYLGQSASVGDALGTAFRRFLPLLGTTFLVALFSFLGTLACCIPGIYVSIIYMFASQVVVAESLGGMSALNRSASLVSGHWWRLFAVTILIVIISSVIQGIVIVPLAVLMPAQEFIQTDTGMRQVFHVKNQLIQSLVQAPFQVVFLAYQAVCTTLLYLDMRIRKEGLDLQIAAQQIEQGGEDVR